MRMQTKLIALGTGWLLAAGLARGVPAQLMVEPTNVVREIWTGMDAGSNRFEIWNGGTNGDGTADLMTFTNRVLYTDSGTYTNWLSVDRTSGSSQGERQAVWIRLDTAGLPPREAAYAGLIRVEGRDVGLGADAIYSPREVQVRVRVFGYPMLSVSPASFTKTITEGHELAGDTLFVANTGEPPRAVMTYTVSVSSAGGWLSANPASGAVQDGSNEVLVGYSPASLAPNVYTGQLTVVAPGVGAQVANVSLTITRRPLLSWDAPTKVWTNEIPAGGSVGSVSVSVHNASAMPRGQLNFTVGVNGDLAGVAQVEPSSGISTGNIQGFRVTYNTAGLGVGLYTGNLTLTGVDDLTGEPVTNGPLTMGLKIIVKGAAALKVSPGQLNATVPENASASVPLKVWNNGPLPHGSMRYTTSVDVAWAVPTPRGGVVSDQTGTVSVAFQAGALAPGTYNGTLTVRGYDAQSGVQVSGSPSSVPLTMVVQSRQPLNLEPPRVDGALHVGHTAEAYVGLWQNQNRLTFTYQWERARTAAGVGAQVIAGATARTYKIAQADLGWYLRVKVTATDAQPFPLRTTVPSPWESAAKVKAVRADFNGDGITDLWYYNEAEGIWRANFGTYQWASGPFGGPGNLAVPGDYNGDGHEDVCVYEKARGIWHVLLLPRMEYASGSLFGGIAQEAEAQPVPADYDGDGATDAALFWKGYWAVLRSTSWQIQVIQPFAGSAGTPLTGDWNGNGLADMAVYQSGRWTIRYDTGGVEVFQFGGLAGQQPVPGDFDGDGLTDLAVYDPARNQWRYRESKTGQDKTVSFGLGGVLAIPGYYDRDSKLDFGQARLSSDLDFIIWEIKRTTETAFPYRGQSYQQSTDRWRVSW